MLAATLARSCRRAVSRCVIVVGLLVSVPALSPADAELIPRSINAIVIRKLIIPIVLFYHEFANVFLAVTFALVEDFC